MFCKKCGKQIDSDSTFCQFCGEKVKTNTEISSKTAQVKPTQIETEKEKIVLIKDNTTHEGSALGILSIVFAFFFAIIGFIFGFIGLSNYKEQHNITNCKIGIAISSVFLLLEIISIFVYVGLANTYLY